MQRLVSFTVALLGVAACVDSPATSQLAQSITAGFAAPVGTVWSSNTIRVCWTAGSEPMSSSTVGALAPELDVIEALIHTAWEPTVNVRWVFSRDCVTDYDVALDVQGNQSISYGRDLHDQPPVGIDFAIRQESAAARQARLRDEALLASGRILGLEWFVFDDSEPCQSPFRRGCSDHSPLLPSTVLAATALYGGAEGVYISPLGQCMQVVTPYQTWKFPYLTVQDCGTPTPVWWNRFVLLASGIYARGIATVLNSTSILMQSPINGTQYWEAWSQGTLTSVGGRCLTLNDVPSYRTCENTTDQTLNVWLNLGWSSPIRATTCLHAISDTTLETTTNCAENREWFWEAHGVLRNTIFNRCLTIPDGGGDEDAPVTIEPCRAGATNQRWTFSGEVRTRDDNPSPGVWGAPASASEVPVVLSKEIDRYDVNGVRLEVRERWWSYVP